MLKSKQNNTNHHANRRITLHPSAPASLTAQAIHPLPLRLMSAFQPLSAHKALASISRSLPEEGFGANAGDGAREAEYLARDASVQSITRTFLILLDVVWVLDCDGSRDGFGDRSVEKEVVGGLRRMSRMEIRVYVNALWRGCPPTLWLTHWPYVKKGYILDDNADFMDPLSDS